MFDLYGALAEALSVFGSHAGPANEIVYRRALAAPMVCMWLRVGLLLSLAQRSNVVDGVQTFER